jgi:hypothetical protein
MWEFLADQLFGGLHLYHALILIIIIMIVKTRKGKSKKSTTNVKTRRKKKRISRDRLTSQEVKKVRKLL